MSYWWKAFPGLDEMTPEAALAGLMAASVAGRDIVVTTISPRPDWRTVWALASSSREGGHFIQLRICRNL
jgi:hypothetical protein